MPGAFRPRWWLGWPPTTPSLLELARWTDFLAIITPGGAGTRHLIDAAVLDNLQSFFAAGRLVSAAPAA